MNTYTIPEIQNTIVYTLFFCVFILVIFYYIYKILESIIKFIINLIFEKRKKCGELNESKNQKKA